LDFPG